MSQQRRQRPKTEETMKVTMTACMAGPDGVARPGTVIDVPEVQAKEMIDGRYARQYDQKRDAKAPRGIQREGTSEQ